MISSNKSNNSPISRLFAITPSLVFFILVAYTYAWFFESPYLGFYYASSSGRVINVFTESSPLQIGDTITQINGQDLPRSDRHFSSSYFSGYSPGKSIPITYSDQVGSSHTIDWEFVGFTRAEFFERVNSAWWISWVFYLAGTVAFLTIRPRDRKWRLFVAFNYMTGIWLLMGNGLSTYNTWYSSVLLRICVWLSLPVYLELNWVFPEPFFKASRRLILISELVLTGLAIELVVADIYGALPYRIYINAFLLTLAACLVLLVLHLTLQRSARPSILLLFRFALVSFLPMILVAVADIFMEVPSLSLGAATTFLVLLPLGYYYAIFRHRLGNLEFRANRALSLVIFIFLLITLFSLLLGGLQVWLGFGQLFFLVSISSIVLATVTSLLIFPFFQKLVEHYILRIPFATRDLVSMFSDQVTTASSTEKLVELIQDQILPVLLIRQSALISLTAQPQYSLVYTEGIGHADLPDKAHLLQLKELSRRYLVNVEELPVNLQWIRIVIPLIFDQQVIGLWLLGKRDPDDFYSANLIQQLQTLANQTSIAMVNNQQSQNLRALYQANINRHELERTNLARDLHDDTLNSLTVLQRDVNDPELIEKTDQIIANLRKIVQGLRPGMLAYGLHTALEDLADMLNERQQNTRVIANIEGRQVKLDPDFELHAFRIIQQACENALQHAGADTLRITGIVSQQKVDIVVEDDGIGITFKDASDLDELLENKHFGLAGMLERASLANAHLTIKAGSQGGTRIQLLWEKPSGDLLPG